MEDESKNSTPQLFPLFLQQDIKTLASLGVLQEIGKTHREVMERHDKEMERHDKEVDALFPFDCVHLININSRRRVTVASEHWELVGRLKLIMAYFSGLGLPCDVDLTAASNDLEVCISTIVKLKACYNKWRMEQSAIVAQKITDAINKLRDSTKVE